MWNQQQVEVVSSTPVIPVSQSILSFWWPVSEEFLSLRWWWILKTLDTKCSSDIWLVSFDAHICRMRNTLSTYTHLVHVTTPYVCVWMYAGVCVYLLSLSHNKHFSFCCRCISSPFHLGETGPIWVVTAGKCLPLCGQTWVKHDIAPEVYRW